MASRGRGSTSRQPANVRRNPSHPPLYKKVLSETTYRFLMRERNVKVVLGPEGKHIKEMKDKCQEECKITIYTQSADGEPFPPDSPDRIINIDASLTDLEIILSDLIPHLQIAPPDKMVNKYNEIRLVVPEFTCSMIIGRKGENVKGIQKDLKSFVQVHKAPLPNSSEYVVSLTNSEVGALAASVIRIFDSIKSIKCISHVTMFNPVVWYPGEYGDTGSYIESRKPQYNHQQERHYRESPHQGVYQNKQRYEYQEQGYDRRGYDRRSEDRDPRRNESYNDRRSYSRGHDNRRGHDDRRYNNNHGNNNYDTRRNYDYNRRSQQPAYNEPEQAERYNEEDGYGYNDKRGARYDVPDNDYHSADEAGCPSCGSAQETSYPAVPRRPHGNVNGTRGRGYIKEVLQRRS